MRGIYKAFKIALVLVQGILEGQKCIWYRAWGAKASKGHSLIYSTFSISFYMHNRSKKVFIPHFVMHLHKNIDIKCTVMKKDFIICQVSWRKWDNNNVWFSYKNAVAGRINRILLHILVCLAAPTFFDLFAICFMYIYCVKCFQKLVWERTQIPVPKHVIYLVH